MRPTEFIATLRKGEAGAAYFLRGPDRFLQEECRKAVVNSIVLIVIFDYVLTRFLLKS